MSTSHPSPAPRRRLALSPSRAGDFKQCPLLYRLRAVDRIPEAPSKAQVRGTVTHAALEALFALPQGRRVPAAALDLVGPAWESVLAASPEAAGLVAQGGLEGFLDEVRALVRTYYTMEDPTRFSPQSCETLVEAEVADGVPLRGFVDRIDVAPTGEVRVVDYKTGKSPGPLGEAAAVFQLKFYALVLLRTRGVVPAQLKLMYLSDGRQYYYTPTAEELDSFEGTLAAIWRAIVEAGRSGQFPPKPSKLCGWCDHKQRCPSFGGTPPPYPGWPGD